MTVAGEAEVLAESPGRARQQPRAADVGGEADAGLGHRELRALGHDADRGVAGEPDAAAHRDAVGEGDERLRVLGDAGVERVLLAEEQRRLLGGAADRALVESAHVSARAQPPLAGAVQQHDVDVGVVLPGVEGGGEDADHVEVERVDGPRTVEGQSPERSARADEHLLLGPVPVRSRAPRYRSPKRARRPATTRTARVPRSHAHGATFRKDRGNGFMTTRGFGMPEGQVLEFSAVTKRFGAVTAVDDFSARVEPGRVTGFLGPNGAGKTTTLRILLGLVRATDGHRDDRRRPVREAAPPAADRRRRARGIQLPPGPHRGEPPQGVRAGGGHPHVARRRGARPRGARRRRRAARSAATRWACASDSDSPTRCSATPACSCSTSRRTASTPRASSGCAGSCASSPARAARCSSRRTCSPRCSRRSTRCSSSRRDGWCSRARSTSSPIPPSTRPSSTRPIATALVRGAARGGRRRSRCSARASPCADSSPAQVGQIAADAGVALSALQRRGPALEEVFLDLVNGTRVHSSAAGQAGQVPDAAPLAVGAGRWRVPPSSTAQTRRMPTPAPIGAAPAAEAPVDDAVDDALDDAEAAAGEPAAVVSTDDEAADDEVVPAPKPTKPPKPMKPIEAASGAAAFAVASTGVIDIIPPAESAPSGTPRTTRMTHTPCGQQARRRR